MKKLIHTFILSSIIKSLLLFIIVASGLRFPEFPIIIRYLFFLAIMIFIDVKITKKIFSLIPHINLIKVALFTFATSIVIIPVTGNMFVLYNWIFEIIPKDNGGMPISALIVFAFITLFISLLTSIISKQKINKTTANKR